MIMIILQIILLRGVVIIFVFLFPFLKNRT